jgi:uncharacterized surface protein with fasciclin (FAS1) repeats
MKDMIIISLFLQLLLVVVHGKDSSIALRGSVVQLPVDDDKNEIRRHLLPEDLMTLSLWDYMEKVDKTFSEKDQYARFRALVAGADLKDDLMELTGITLLAPTDSGISREIKDFLLQSENKVILREVVEYHMIPRVISFLSPELKQASKVTTFTVAGVDIDISVNGKELSFNKMANAVAYALINESIIYKIDRLLIPPSMNSRIPEEVLATNMKKTDKIVGPDLSYEFPITLPDTLLVDGDVDPDDKPTEIPDNQSPVPSDSPSMAPSDSPSMAPSVAPSMSPSIGFSTAPSDVPSMFPVEPPVVKLPLIVFDDVSDIPSSQPSQYPSSSPSDVPSSIPSDLPSSIQSNVPSSIPSTIPSTGNNVNETSLGRFNNVWNWKTEP